MTDDNILVFKPRPYRTPQSTIDAFWFLVQINDEPRLKAWLQAHPKDRQTCSNFMRSARMSEPKADGIRRVFMEIGEQPKCERHYDPNCRDQ